MKTPTFLFAISAGVCLALYVCNGDTNAPAKPIKLQSVAAAQAAQATNQPAAAPSEPPTPVYVIPEAVLVRTPQGVIVFAAEIDVQRLAKLYPAMRLTNVVFYSK